MVKYGWIFGIFCIPLGISNLYFYFSGGSSDKTLLILGISALCAATFNLAVYSLK